MKRALWSGGVAAGLMIAGCGDGAVGPQEGGDINPISAASAPVTVPFFAQFEDVNPCTGLVHTVTITGTERVHEHDGRLVAHGDRTITTSSGFAGRGTHTAVVNNNVFKLSLNDILRHPSGDRIRAHFTLVIDLSSSTVKVEKGSLTCVGR